MSYTVLARRYRSAAFGEVVGQEHVARTLGNAIATGRVAHAFLFCGTRGVGKTSMARIFARALNAPDTIPDCPKPPDGAAFPPVDVQQRMAEAIMRGDDLNVIEIDGASNNGVENARNLIANAALAPTNAALYKIYIIDEVHMLSTAAFNALLKTMEEPPSHVKFILCTTEAHKVPATIQSRCQRFDFRNIPTARIAAHLKEVLAKEDIQADEQVVWELARLGSGSMRDALSLLDRLIAAGQSPLSAELLEQMLGMPAAKRVAALVDALASGDVAGTLDHAAGLLDQGIAQDQIFEVLIERFRHLMLLSACGSATDLVEMPDEARKEAAQQAAKFDPAGLAHMIAVCESVQRMSKNSSNARALFDAAMVRLALAEKMADVTALLTGEAAKKKAPGDRSPVTGPGATGGLSGATGGLPVSADVSTPRNTGGQAPSATRAAEGVTDRQASASSATALSDDQKNDPAAVWGAVLAVAAGRAPLGWIRKLNLMGLGEHSATLAVSTGGGDTVRFITDRQRQQLGELVAQVLGRPVKIAIRSEPAQPSPSQSQPSETDAADRRGVQQQAMSLPLVKKVMETFDNVMLVDVSRALTEPTNAQDNEHR